MRSARQRSFNRRDSAARGLSGGFIGGRYRRGAIPSHFKAALLMFTDTKLDYRGTGQV